MKITFNKQLVEGPWGGGNQFLRLFLKYLENNNIKISFTLDEDTAVVMILDVKDSSSTFTYDELCKFKENHNIKVITRANDNSKHRSIPLDVRDNLTFSYAKLSDKIIFISQWLKTYFMMQGMDMRKSIVIDNACDRSLFKSDMHMRKPNDPLKFVSHHWSNNMAKGYDCYEKLSEFCNAYPDIARFRFIGNAPDGYLRKTQIFPPQNYIDIPQYLQDQDVYISATYAESGGYHIVEGMACGLIPFIKFGSGGPLSYAYNYCISFENIEEMIYQVKGLYNNYDMYQYLHNKVNSEYTYGSDDMCKQYLDVINATINDPK